MSDRADRHEKASQRLWNLTQEGNEQHGGAPARCGICFTPAKGQTEPRVCGQPARWIPLPVLRFLGAASKICLIGLCQDCALVIATNGIRLGKLEKDALELLTMARELLGRLGTMKPVSQKEVLDTFGRIAAFEATLQVLQERMCDEGTGEPPPTAGGKGTVGPT